MKIIEIVVDQGHYDTILGIAEQQGVVDHWPSPVAEDNRRSVRMLVRPDSIQAVLDALQSVLGSNANARVIVTPVEVSLPPLDEDLEDERIKRKTALSREELYDTVYQNTKLNGRFLLLVFLSTIVVTIGLLENNVAVVIGAMVIAPFLGPNIALALGTALGDNALIWQSLKTNLVGMTFTLSLCILLGWWWPYEMDSQELLSRTDVGLDSIAIALASGAAAVLSMTTGLSSILVGVMVAVALLPPTAALGFMIGSGHYDLATGAALLLAVNIVSVNLSAKLGFLFMGIKPRTWLDQQRARQSMTSYIIFWVISLLALGTLVYLRDHINVV